MKVFCRYVLFLLAGLMFFASGCLERGQATAEQEYRIGFSQCVGSDLWRRTMLQEMQMELSLHPKSKLVYADADNSSKRQIRQVRDMLRQGIDLLVISPNEALPLTAIVEETYKKGIPVVVVDRKTSSSLYTAYVGAENYQVGKIAGDYLASELKGHGRVLEIMGLPGSSPAIERSRGLADALKSHPGISLSGQLYGDWLSKTTEQQLFKYRDKLKGTDAVFAHNDVMAASARKVLKQFGLDKGIRVVGVDAQPGRGGGLDMVSSGILSASVLYPTGGKEAIGIAMKILNKQSFAKENILQTVVIDSSTVQLMKLQWARIRSQQTDIERQQSLLADQFRIYSHQRLVLNFIVITLVLAVVFGGLAFHALLENRKINRSLEQKNEEILLQRNQLIEMSERAAAATEAKLSFFTNISHEFRTPLTLILSPLEDLLKAEKPGSAGARELGLIHRNVYRLLRLVNQLMDYRKIEYKQFKLKATPNQLADFLQEITGSFRYNAEKQNIDLRLVLKDKPAAVWFDLNMLDKVIFNLLSNALKFTPQYGRITVTLSSNASEAVVEVTDNGIGMTEAELARAFDPFYQSDTNYNRGSGLGLSLSRELMLLHKGSISASSTKGSGTTFRISLLLGESHLSEEEKAAYTADFDQVPEPKSTAAYSPLRDHSVLIIEDNAELLDYMGNKFEKKYEIFTAPDGVTGLATAYEKVPDLIISDVVIPGMNGKELCHQLKSDLRTSHIPVILLTAQDRIEQQITGIQSRADLYLTKPFNFEYLEANVENLIRSRDLLREHYISDVSPGGKKATGGLDRKFLNDFAGLVETNLGNEHFSIDELSKAIGISRVHLYRKVKALLNCSVTDYVLNRRLAKAKYYLGHEQYTVSEISYLVGISSPAYFSTVFKNKYGLSPTAYRKSKI